MTDLVALLGRENVERLADVAGGTRLFIPRNYGKPPRGGRDTTERLNGLVGPELAILLVFHFGGEAIYVPRLKPADPIDPAKLKRLERKGLSAREVALQLGCCARTVEKHRQKTRLNGKPKQRREARA